MLVFVRASAFLAALPVFSATNMPTRLRIVVGALLALFVSATLGDPVDLSRLQLSELVILVLKEGTVGYFLGSVGRLLFWSIQVAGHFISTEIGLQMSTLLTPTDSVPVEVPAAILNLLAMMLFLSLDIHLQILAAFQHTYDVLPIGKAVLSDALLHDLTVRVSKILLLGVEIAAPLMAVGFLVSIVLLMLGRAVPQMNIFAESFTIRIIVGLGLFGFSLTLAAERIADQLRQLPGDLLNVAKLLSGS